ncbi:MAG: type II toxin-antitoxin system RelE/ParE family toxin [Chloroflexi bacterium]|nr:type II toxin-antitoxin system RelE/ParE family toxin [Chloroflexota bacterium]
MIVVVESATFKKWVRGLRDRRAVARINARLRNISLGNFGDSKPIADKVSEIRIHYGPGYRLYFAREGNTFVVLLCGGVKGSQRRDIERAKRLADDWR